MKLLKKLAAFFRPCRSTQEIFDVVIDNNLYNNKNSFMCLSLKDALADNLITYKEYVEAANSYTPLIFNH